MCRAANEFETLVGGALHDVPLRPGGIFLSPTASG